MFDPTTSPDGVYAVLFTAPSCSLCSRARSRFSSARRGRAGISFVEEDVLRSPSLAAKCRVESVPSVRVLHIVDGHLQKIEDPRTWEPGDTDGEESSSVMTDLKGVVR